MPLSDYKILVVDDEDDILEIVSFNLRKAGYRVYIANSPEIAFNIAMEQIPHLILLDIMMPGKDGIQLCNEIRSIRYLQDCIIAFFSACSEDQMMATAFACGAQGYITKPIRPKDLLVKINHLLKLNVPVGR
ncbi:MAG TPA: response regulator [Bacteroidales bacterium]|nr:response regulator [Bacteroidales bacterium]